MARHSSDFDGIELVASAVAKRYGRRGPWVLRDVELAVPAAQLVHVRGENGPGKSTLLRILAGACAPAQGEIRSRPPRVGLTAGGALTRVR